MRSARQAVTHEGQRLEIQAIYTVFAAVSQKPRPSLPSTSPISRYPTSVTSLPVLMLDLLEVFICVFIYIDEASWEHTAPLLASFERLNPTEALM